MLHVNFEVGFSMVFFFMTTFTYRNEVNSQENLGTLRLIKTKETSSVILLILVLCPKLV